MIDSNLLRRCARALRDSSIALRTNITMVGNLLQGGARVLCVGISAVVGNPLRIYAHALRTNNNTWFYTFVVFAIISLIMTALLGGFGPIYQSKVDVGQEPEASQIRHNMARGFGAKTNDQLAEAQLRSLPHGQSGLIIVRHWIARKIFLRGFIFWSALALISIPVIFRDEVGDLFRRFRQRLSANVEETDEEQKTKKKVANSSATGGTAVSAQAIATTPPVTPPATPLPTIQPIITQGQPSITSRFILELIVEWLAEIVSRRKRK